MLPTFLTSWDGAQSFRWADVKKLEIWPKETGEPVFGVVATHEDGDVLVVEKDLTRPDACALLKRLAAMLSVDLPPKS